MKKIILITISFISLSFFKGSQPAAVGKLLISGGGSYTADEIAKFIKMAGGPDSKIIIIPMAFSNKLESAREFAEEFEKPAFIKAGSKNVDFIVCNKELADQDSILEKLKCAKGVYFSGGDQSKLTSALGGTKLLEAIKTIYKNGGIISGTSAGAAVMSLKMITGKDISAKDDTNNNYTTIQKDNIELTRGFGFLNNAIVDQHFIIRKRNNRLLSVVLENPDLLGIGIDESTSIIVEGNVFEVIGTSQVIVFDASKSKVSADKNGLLKAHNVIQYVLTAGDRFDMVKRKVLN